MATITGTAGFEALVRQKPVLVFGYPWYRGAPGLFEIRGIASCRAALQKIASGFSFSEKEVLHYLSAFDSATFHGYIDADGQQVSALSAAENAENISEAIASLLARTA